MTTMPTTVPASLFSIPTSKLPSPVNLSSNRPTLQFKVGFFFLITVVFKDLESYFYRLSSFANLSRH